MKLPRRNLLHLATGAAALPEIARFAACGREGSKASACGASAWS
jgi:hypothetical protein